VAALPGGTYNIKVTAKGFETYEANSVKLNVAEKIRVDVQLTVGQVTERVIVEGSNVAQVETQSSDISGTILGSQITQLQLNGRNFVQLAALTPGATNQTGQDEGTVGPQRFRHDRGGNQVWDEQFSWRRVLLRPQ